MMSTNLNFKILLMIPQKIPMEPSWRHKMKLRNLLNSNTLRG